MTTNDTRVELKGCPFCGNKPMLCDSEFAFCYSVTCGTCSGSTGYNATPDAAAAAWNTRVQPESWPVEAKWAAGGVGEIAQRERAVNEVDYWRDRAERFQRERAMFFDQLEVAELRIERLIKERT